MKTAVIEAIKESAAVPSVPQVVVRFLEVIQNPDFEYEELVKVMSTDPGTVSEVLRLGNSALFGVRQKIVSLRQALTLLGPTRTRSLVLGRYLVAEMGAKTIEGFDMSYFWRRSLTSAVVGASFADQLVPQLRDDVFISALLADIGIPILAEAMPDCYGPIVDRYAPMGEDFTDEEEREAVGTTHAEVSALVLTYWSLPELVTRAVNLQQADHPRHDEDEDAGTIARILNSSDRIAKILCEVPDMERAATVCAEATAFIDVDNGVLLDLLTQIENEIEELASILRIDVIPGHVYALIAEAIQERLTVETSC